MKIFDDLTIYKKVREEVLSGEDFDKIAEKFSGEEKFAKTKLMLILQSSKNILRKLWQENL